MIQLTGRRQLADGSGLKAPTQYFGLVFSWVGLEGQPCSPTAAAANSQQVSVSSDPRGRKYLSIYQPQRLTSDWHHRHSALTVSAAVKAVLTVWPALACLSTQSSHPLRALYTAMFETAAH